MTVLSTLSSRRVAGALALTLGAALAAPLAHAKAGGGSSFGSRGGRTFSAPSATPTAPGAAQPMQRTQTAPSYAGPNAGSPAAAAPGRRFGGFGTGLAAGLLGAGLFGMLGGSGFFGGIGGLASMMGFLVQLALIAGLVWLAVRFFRSRSQPAFAAAGMPRSALGPDPAPQRPSMTGGGMGPQMGAQQAVPIQVEPGDYEAFERTLNDVQLAYGSEDMAALSRVATPEMVQFMGADIAENQRRGVRNEMGVPKLLQGDLSEAWREGPAEYATVAMRFSVTDVMVDRNTGRVVAGDRNRPDEVTELWTFRRENRGSWMLSAIQQTR